MGVLSKGKSLFRRSTGGEKGTGSRDGSGDEFEDAADAQMHPHAHDEGGLAFVNKELLEKQRSAIIELVKEVGKKLLTGNINLISISMPVKMFEPRSYLQKLTDVWVYPRFLAEAAEASDPLVRLQKVMTWFVAGLQHVFESWRKPFNPLLGETWQATLTDGSEIFLEQISHHPPISAFQLIGPDGIYTFSGLSQPDVSYKGNAIKTTAKGSRRIVFRDGTEIHLNYPAYFMRGIMYSSMPRGDLSGTTTFVDTRNSLVGLITFGKVAGQEDKQLLQRPDSFAATIHRSPGATLERVIGSSSGRSRGLLGGFLGTSSGSGEPDALGRLLASGTGNWLSHLDWDDGRWWTLSEEHKDAWQAVAEPLPSDSRYREDLVELAKGDLAKAQAAKEALENLQRADAKARKQAAEA